MSTCPITCKWKSEDSSVQLVLSLYLSGFGDLTHKLSEVHGRFLFPEKLSSACKQDTKSIHVIKSITINPDKEHLASNISDDSLTVTMEKELQLRAKLLCFLHVIFFFWRRQPNVTAWPHTY